MLRNPPSLVIAVACAASACGNGTPRSGDEAPSIGGGPKEQTFPGATEPIENCDPAGAFTTDITNPFFPLPVCSRRVYVGDDDGTEVMVRITVLDEIEVVAGVPTRVVEEYETEDGELVEISYNYFAQAVGGGTPPGATSPRDGTVCYFGERVDIYNEDGTITHEGAWRAGEDGARPGIIMPGVVAKGQAYLQEVAPGIAEDRAWHTKLAGDRLVVLEDTPLEPGALSEKAYCEGIGLVRDNDAELVSSEVLDDCRCEDDDDHDDRRSRSVLAPR